MSACAICGHETTPWLRQPLDPKKNEPSPYAEFVRCGSCGHGAMFPLPSPDEIPGFYQLPQYYTQGDSHIAPHPATLADKVLTKLAYLADKRGNFDPAELKSRLPGNAAALDIGCGGGALLEQYHALGWKAVGIEPDPATISRKSDAIDVHAGTGEDIPDAVRARQYQLISMTHVLEHCIDPLLALKNVHALLADEGVFWCEVPNAACVHFETMNICSENFDAPRHLHFFTEESLRVACDAAGLEITETYFWGLTRHHNRDWREWEKTIHDRTLALDPTAAPPRHSFGASVAMLAQEAFAAPAQKYDCFGVLAKKR